MRVRVAAVIGGVVGCALAGCGVTGESGESCTPVEIDGPLVARDLDDSGEPVGESRPLGWVRWDLYI